MWELQEEVSTGIPATSYMIGYIGKDEVVIKNTVSGSIHVTNLSHNTTRQVIKGTIPHDIYRCASLDDGRIVCGTRNGQIIIFNLEWTHISTIAVNHESNASILVSVSKDGLILAAVYGRCIIRMFDPTDGKELQQVYIQSERAIHEMRALSSGDIAIFTKHLITTNIILCVIDGSGVEKFAHEYYNKDAYGIAADRSRDSIFIMYRDRQRDDYTVDKISLNGTVLEERIMSLRTLLYYPTCVVLHGQLDHIILVIHSDSSGRLHVFSWKAWDIGSPSAETS